MRISDWSSDVCSSDLSASTRLAVWAWTWDYAKKNPLGGGFEAYRQNSLRVNTVSSETTAAVEVIDRTVVADQGRAYNSSSLEMLDEPGFPGLIPFLLLHGNGLVRKAELRRRYREALGDPAWMRPPANRSQTG